MTLCNSVARLDVCMIGWCITRLLLSTGVTVEGGHCQSGAAKHKFSWRYICQYVLKTNVFWCVSSNVSKYFLLDYLFICFEAKSCWCVSLNSNCVCHSFWTDWHTRANVENVWYGWNRQMCIHCPDGRQTLKLSFKATKFVPVSKKNLRSPLRPRTPSLIYLLFIAPPPYLICPIT